MYTTHAFSPVVDRGVVIFHVGGHGKGALTETAQSPRRRFVTLAVEGGDVPEYGAAVTSGGEPAGTLTSPCESPTLGRVIGMAVLEARFAGLGSRVEVALGDGTAVASVEPLPVYDPEKRRPRA